MNGNPINEHFFDEESKDMRYILGISYSLYALSETDDGNTWTSSSNDSLDLVQKALETEQSIGGSNERGSRNYQVGSQYLQDRLKEKGLGVPRSERVFPEDCEEQYLDHFVRGFFDAQVSVSKQIAMRRSVNRNHPYNYKRLNLSFNSVQFLQGLYHVLVQHAHVKGGGRNPKMLYFADSDTKAIHDFLYRDWDYIQKHGLYLPSKKEKFRV